MLRSMRSKAQSTAEYAIVIGLVIAAAVAMQIYVKRGLQAKIKDAVDYRPNAAGADVSAVLSGDDYEPDYLSSEMRSTSNTYENVGTDYGGKVTRKLTGTGDVSTKTGNQVLAAP